MEYYIDLPRPKLLPLTGGSVGNKGIKYIGIIYSLRFRA